MRILTFTDMHGSMKAFKIIKQRAKKADLILNCGDFTNFGQNQKSIIKKFDKLNKPMLIIHGNHEIKTEIEKLCKKTKNIIFLHEKTRTIKNILILGHGGGGFSLSSNRFDKKIIIKFKERISKFKKTKKENKKIILMTHAPPYKTNIDNIGGEHCGSKSYREFIVKNKPNYAFSGHLHEDVIKKTSDKIKKTIIVNPGPIGRIYEV